MGKYLKRKGRRDLKQMARDIDEKMRLMIYTEDKDEFYRLSAELLSDFVDLREKTAEILEEEDGQEEDISET